MITSQRHTGSKVSTNMISFLKIGIKIPTQRNCQEKQNNTNKVKVDAFMAYVLFNYVFHDELFIIAKPKT